MKIILKIKRKKPIAKKSYVILPRQCAACNDIFAFESIWKIKTGASYPFNDYFCTECCSNSKEVKRACVVLGLMWPDYPGVS